MPGPSNIPSLQPWGIWIMQTTYIWLLIPKLMPTVSFNQLQFHWSIKQVNEKKTSHLMKISTRQQSSECDWKPIEECKTAYLGSKVTNNTWHYCDEFSTRISKASKPLPRLDHYDYGYWFYPVFTQRSGSPKGRSWESSCVAQVPHLFTENLMCFKSSN